ncbi:MAG: glucokinase [Rhodocyclaceae bacterium]|nr:glucokinase [Rhodocyclaceae bacterium]
MILCGDVGGTKALLGLADFSAGHLQMRHRQRLECADFANFPSLLAAFLAAIPAGLPHPDGGCLAVAGPVGDDGRRARLTNLPWTVDCAALESAFGLPQLRLVNDFAAAAMGVLVADARELVTLQAGETLTQGVKLVVGAGTGLGMAVLVPDPSIAAGWRVLPGEGGHVGFAPQNEVQGRIWAALLQEYGRVTNERVISGSGLTAIHRILANEVLKPAAIAAAALKDAQGTARASVDVFLAAYGAYAGDMALALMARGGVYLAGGIAARLRPLMAVSHDNNTFLTAFNAKAEHASLAARMPVAIAIDPDLGLKGAALLA